ncbi:MAG: hypothetical protein A3G34_02365 [Candidatus Lindowbacteria bacterium RIFCSPLOWO2_12_FULL_62_27]|nr:MAG: hypothetical protein A3G34_02365 [Candidatus Lindowbacteria bacterium RIFCSPLOWO2_12_FULL_62_27]OGH62016.1 MAG: hypothetical protein A3I06_02150 [Candidatus Lindowbacteria bacterium RIFCSPLOWO2_02_FULL_62_12]
MRILTKYCLREELKLFLAALFFFSGLLLLGQVMNLLRLVLKEGAALWNILSIVALWFPTGISYAIPMSLLFAILIGYGQMAQQEELTAIRAAGVFPAELLTPAIFLGVALSGLLFVNEAWLAPPARLMFRDKLQDARKDIRIENLIVPGQLLTHGPIKFSCQELEVGVSPLFKNVFFEYSDSPGFRILARTAQVERVNGQARFVFENGQILWTDAEKHLSVQFQTAAHVLPVPGRSESKARAKDKSLLEMTPLTAGLSEPERFEFHKKAALVLSPFFFAVFAATLSMLIKRGNRVLGFLLTLTILAGYYILLAVASALHSTSHELACATVWSPNALLLVLGYFFYRMIFLF